MINGGNLDSRVERVRTEIVRVCDVDVQDAASTIPRAMIHTIRLGDVSSAEVSSLANVWCTLITKCGYVIHFNCRHSWDNAEVVSRRVHDGAVVVGISLMVNLKTLALHKLVKGVIFHERFDDTHVTVAIWSCVFMPEANSMANQMHHYSSAVTILSKFDHSLTAIVTYKFGVAARIIPTGTSASVSIGRGELKCSQSALFDRKIVDMAVLPTCSLHRGSRTERIYLCSK